MLTVFQGFFVIVSMLVPGVSGSTMMIVFGIYDRTLTILSAWSKGKFIEKPFIFKLILGGLIGLLGFSYVMIYLLNYHGYWMGFFFTGVILSGLIFIARQVDWKTINTSSWLFFILGFSLAIWMDFSPRISLMVYGGVWYEKLVMVFVAGVVIAVALILPGISASYMLLIMGLYDRLLEALVHFHIQVLGPLALGIVLGGLLTVRLFTWLMESYPGPTYLVIMGFVLGSLPILFPSFPMPGQVGFAMLWFMAGVGLILLLHQLSQKDIL